LGNPNSAFIVDGFDEKIRNEEGIFDRRGVDTDPFYQQFGCVLGNRERQKELSKAHKK
jgi:hypothetical protein